MKAYRPEFDVDFKFEDILSVVCDHSPGFRGSRETPAELGGYTPHTVTWRGIDITGVLDPVEIEKITEKCNEETYTEGDHEDE